MLTLQRNPDNPILIPNTSNAWEHDGAFNGCVVYANGVYHMVYRALSAPTLHNGVHMQVSSVGYAQSSDGVHFGDHKLLFSPTEDWEIYGCEDPRITYIDETFYIFYTALSVYPFAAYGIKLAVAKTKDFKDFEKHPVTTFNAKAMALFPEKINGKMAALLTMHTDLPPAKIAFAGFDKEEDMWSQLFWNDWYEHANDDLIHLMRDMRDQVELGAPPVKTDQGWLVLYSYIKNYLSDEKVFGIEAVLLDLTDPRKILGRTQAPLLTPQEEYELAGVVPNVVFPSGAHVADGKLLVYYGAADTRCAVASCGLKTLLLEMLTKPEAVSPKSPAGKLVRFAGNPILKPALELEWQAGGVYNPGAIYLDGTVHLIYRAQAKNGVSVLGYATSKDGTQIDEMLDEPIYTPREDFEKMVGASGNSGCEDPRITLLNNRLYMTYTAYDGKNPPRVAVTSIQTADFLTKQWNWEKPVLISPPGADDKNACIVKHKKGEGYLAFHRLGEDIWLDFIKTLEFSEKNYLSGSVIAKPRHDRWDNIKVGIAAPPIETDDGWLLLYHGLSGPSFAYKVGAMLLDYADPRNVLLRTPEPILEPDEPYEFDGRVPKVVFPCGAIVKDAMLYVYYGGADTVVCVATKNLNDLLREMKTMNGGP